VASQAARVELDRGHPAAARRRLVRLIAVYPHADELRGWLRLVYRTYAAEGRWKDAAVAVRRYRRGSSGDKERDPTDRVEQARILLQGGDAGQALKVVGADPKGPEGRALRIRILRKAGKLDKAYQAARTWAEADQAPDPGRAWRILAEIAEKKGDLGTYVKALEHALQETPDPVDREVVERAWEAYLQLGAARAKKTGLGVGEDERWVARGAKAGGAGGRAMLASVSLLGGSKAVRRKARIRLVEALGNADLARCALRLFRMGPAFQGKDVPSPLLRVHLGRVALAAHWYQRALHWMDTVGDPPEQVKAAPWLLTRARLRIKLGRYAPGAEDLRDILKDPEPLREKAFRDRFLQVVFEIEQADRYQEALGIFRAVYDAVKEPKARRELLFWKAECHEGMGEHRRAAELFMRSAAHPPGNVQDRWGRTARFRAARSLEQTSYVEDARRLYRALLGSGSSKQDLAVLRRLHRLEVKGVASAGG